MDMRDSILHISLFAHIVVHMRPLSCICFHQTILSHRLKIKDLTFSYHIVNFPGILCFLVAPSVTLLLVPSRLSAACKLFVAIMCL